MIKISEFNPSISNSKEQKNTANCKVIINNAPNINKSTSDNNVEKTITDEITFVPQYVQSDSVQLNELALYKHLALAFSMILKSNNVKLIANLIDQSGKVILSASDLLTAISLALGIDPNGVKIQYEDPDPSCLGKVNPIKIISTIKVCGYDFNLAYNKQYNQLTDEFGISLTKCLII